MMAQNAVAAATAPASGAGIGCWSFQTPEPVSSRSSGAKADGGLPSRSGIATGTGPRGRRTQSLPVRTLLGPLPGHPCPCSYPSAHFERRSLLLLNPAAFPLSRVDPVHDHVHMRVSAPVRHDQRLVLLQPQRFQALRRLPGLNSAAPAPYPWPSYRHMDAIWTPQQIASPYTAIDLAVKYLLFIHLLQCPARDSNPEPTD